MWAFSQEKTSHLWPAWHFVRGFCKPESHGHRDEPLSQGLTDHLGRGALGPVLHCIQGPMSADTSEGPRGAGWRHREWNADMDKSFGRGWSGQPGHHEGPL